jgi:hypothetical protein
MIEREVGMNLFIVAAGLGTRVSPFTHQCIPKFLINLDQHSGLYHMLDFWKDYVSDIFIILHPSFEQVTDFYIETFFPNLNVTYLFYEESDGTAFTIQKSIEKCKNLLTTKETIITWCDLYPSPRKIPFDQFKNDLTILTYGNKCRYEWDGEKIRNVGKTGGNIVGIYHFKDYKILLEMRVERGKDLIECVDDLKIGNYELEGLVDFGDEDKLYEIYEKQEKKTNCRHFNQITISEKGNLMKRAITEQGIDIMKKEANWYRFLCNHPFNEDFDFPIPKIRALQPEYMIMEYLKEYEPFYIHLNKLQPKEIEDILHKLMREVKILHSIETKEVDNISFLTNLKYEIHDKIVERMAKIQNLINSFPKIEYVNGVKIHSFHLILQKVKDILMEDYKKQEKNEKHTYHFIHGDLNFSNIMIHPNSHLIKFIDPRGYFGKSLLLGPKEYDESKVLYAISGYDGFNQDPSFHPLQFDKMGKSITFQMKGYPVSKTFLEKYFKKIHFAYLTIIWLGLAEYNKNNFWKCICSYYQGLYIGTKYLF